MSPGREQAPGAPGPRRVALVTGAARGIGAAVVELLAGAGWGVLATDVCRDDPALSYPLGTREELDALADRHEAVVAHPADVRSQADMDGAVRAALARFGRLDAAVAAAGVMAGGSPLWEIPEAAWEALFAVNVGGVRRLVQAAVPALLSAPPPRQGRVVAVASAAALVGLPLLAGYSASKHAVAGLVRALAADLAGTGITANAVCPGSTAGAMLDESARIYGLSSPEELARHALVGRLLAPEEPAALVAWLCEEASSALTGAVLAADGGLTTS